MGYDIVIAVEFFPDEENFDLPPLDVPNQLINLYFTAANKGQYAFADLVLTPDTGEFSMLDFSKSHKIYSLAVQDRENFRGALEAIREKIYPSSESAPPRSANTSGRAYTELPPIVPQRLMISGAMPSDMGYIKKSFSRLIEGKPLEEDTISAFINSIYKTGHYRLVITRTDIRTGEPCLELALYPDDPAKTLIVTGGSYQGTLSSGYTGTLRLGANLQIRGLTGPHSVVSFGASFLNYLSREPLDSPPLTQRRSINTDSGFSFALLYLQPLTQRMFISADSELTIGPHTQKPAILSALGKIKMGIQFNDTNTLSFGPALFFTGDLVPGEEPRIEGSIPSVTADGSGDEQKTALGFIAGYRFSSLDSQIFATRGLYAKLENTLAFPLPLTRSAVSDSVSIDFSAAIPLGSHFSFITNFFAGTSIHPFFGFSALDRMYFPHLSGNQSRDAHKAASLLILQFVPWKNMTILGGQLVLSVSAAAGQVVHEWRQFSFNDLTWNAAFNTGLRMGKTFGLRLKAGAGSYSSKSVTPFFSIDIGAFRY
jgi:NTE family protein